MKIAVVYGGKSGEHEISLLSASAVVRHIDRKKHSVILIGISQNGRWYIQNSVQLKYLEEDPSYTLMINQSEEKAVSVMPGQGMFAFTVNGSPVQVDVVFPVLHGTNGEDGTIQGLLEMAEIPYVGCGVTASSLAMDKDLTKKILKYEGLPVVPSVTMTRTDISDEERYDEVVRNAIDALGFPLFVKPCSAGSSDGASKAVDEKSLSLALLEAFNWDNKVLIEKALSAREVECSVTGNSIMCPAGDETVKVHAYMTGEIVPTHEFYDYDAKYTDPNGAVLKIPADIPKETRKKIEQIAEKAYTAVNAAGLSRVDFFVEKETGNVFLNEINTMPGFTVISMFPKLCEKAGLSFADQINLLLEEAVQKFRSREALQTSR